MEIPNTLQYDYYETCPFSSIYHLFSQNLLHDALLKYRLQMQEQVHEPRRKNQYSHECREPSYSIRFQLFANVNRGDREAHIREDNSPPRKRKAHPWLRPIIAIFRNQNRHMSDQRNGKKPEREEP